MPPAHCRLVLLVGQARLQPVLAQEPHLWVKGVVGPWQVSPGFKSLGQCSPLDTWADLRPALPASLQSSCNHTGLVGSSQETLEAAATVTWLCSAGVPHRGFFHSPGSFGTGSRLHVFLEGQLLGPTASRAPPQVSVHISSPLEPCCHPCQEGPWAFCPQYSPPSL